MFDLSGIGFFSHFRNRWRNSYRSPRKVVRATRQFGLDTLQHLLSFLRPQGSGQLWGKAGLQNLNCLFPIAESTCFSKETFLLIWHTGCLCSFILFIFRCLVRPQLICVGTSTLLVDWCLFCTLVTLQALWNLRWETGKTIEGKKASLEMKFTHILLKQWHFLIWWVIPGKINDNSVVLVCYFEE